MQEYRRIKKVEREIIALVISQKRDDKRRGSTVNFREQTNINGFSENDGQKIRAQRHELQMNASFHRKDTAQILW